MADTGVAIGDRKEKPSQRLGPETSLEGRVIRLQNTKATASLQSSNDGFFTSSNGNTLPAEQHPQCQSIGAAVSYRIAANPWTCLSFSLLVAVGLSLVGYFVGEFTVTAELDGWLSRGTRIANQNTQTTLVNRNTMQLFTGDAQIWDDLQTRVQGSLTSHDPTQRRRQRQLQQAVPGEFVAASSAFLDLPGCDVE